MSDLSDIVLRRPTDEDVPAIFEIYSDPRVWTHFPSGRPTEIAQVESMVLGWIASWEKDGLGPWIVYDATTSRVLGNVGCAVRRDAFWNLGYRLAFDTHGRGITSRVAVRAIEEAQRVKPELPVIAYLLEHNRASARVAEKVGLQLQYRAPDAGNPDPDAIRLVYADRALTEEQIRAALT